MTVLDSPQDGHSLADSTKESGRQTMLTAIGFCRQAKYMRLRKLIVKKNDSNNTKKISITGAFELGINKSEGGEDHKKVLRFTAKAATDYFTNFAKIQLFNQIQDKHVAGYVGFLGLRRLKPSSMRHYLIPLRLAYNATKFETGQSLDFKSIGLPKRTYGAANYVPAHEMFLVLDTMRAFGKWRPFACMAAGFLAGLRISEFNRLTPDKLRGDELEISGITKNMPSRRVIPIPQALVSILHDWFRMELPPISCVRNLGQQTRNALDSAFESLALHGHVEPREAGRKSWVQWANALNLPDGAVQAYMGHKLRYDILHTNYQFNAPPRPEQTTIQREGPMKKLRELILAPVENAIAESKFRA